jgi:hypothetical protein
VNPGKRPPGRAIAAFFDDVAASMPTLVMNDASGLLCIFMKRMKSFSIFVDISLQVRIPEITDHRASQRALSTEWRESACQEF